ncbi:MAG: hypothetical protein ACHQUC_10450, partial [Chlamydiales bacterium]
QVNKEEKDMTDNTNFDSKIQDSESAQDAISVPQGVKQGETPSGQKVKDITRSGPVVDQAVETARKSHTLVTHTLEPTPSQDKSQVTSHHLTHVATQIPVAQAALEVIGTLHVHEPSHTGSKAFTSDELATIQNFADGYSGMFGVDVKDVAASYAKLHAAPDCQLPEMHKILRQAEQLPENSRSDICIGAASLIIKDIGHEWGLKGKVHVSGADEIPLERSKNDYMSARATVRLEEHFERHPLDDRLDPHSPLAHSSLAKLTQADRTRLQEALRVSITYGSGKAEGGIDFRHSNAKKALANLEKNGLVLMPTGWFEHSINIVLYRDSKGQDFLVYTNRGEKLNGESLNERSFDMQVYKITRPLTTEMIMELMNEDQREVSLSKEVKAERMKFFEAKEPKGMHDLFGLESLINVEKKMQKVGNCSWANTMGGIHAALVMMLMDKELPGDTATTPEIQTVLNTTKDAARDIYKGLTFEIRAKQLRDFLALYDRIESGQIEINKDDFIKVIQQIRAKLASKTSPSTHDPEKKLLTEVDAFLKEGGIPFEAEKVVLNPEEIAHLREQKKYIEYLPKGNVLSGKTPQADDVKNYMIKIAAKLNEGDYIIVQINELPNISEDKLIEGDWNYDKKTRMLVKKDGMVFQYTLDSFSQIERVLAKHVS